MRILLSFLLFIYLLPLTSIGQNQVSVTGTIIDIDTKLPVSGVSIAIKNTNQGVIADDKGVFKINVPNHFPITILITSTGYSDREIEITGIKNLVIELIPEFVLGPVVTVGSSRIPQPIMKAQSTVDRIGPAAITNSPASSYYDVIGQLKGVDFITSSLTFRTYSTRGFNTSGNARVNQIVEGMDNQAPGVNFAVGGMVGLTSLDVDNIELLQGASSALYGPGGMNGTILINSKNPFDHQGLSVEIKQGVNHVDNYEHKAAAYYDWSLRFAKKVSDKFAFKATAQYTQATDWTAVDNSNYLRTNANPQGGVIAGTRASDPNYNGVNVYGDETTGSSAQIVQGFLNGITDPEQKMQLSGLLAPYNTGGDHEFNISRTGYSEKDVINPKTFDLKIGGGLYYNVSPNTQLSAVGFWGTGSTVYTGGDRYTFKNFKIGQYKLELKNKNWFVRGYTTQENSGESYNATVTTRLLNEGWKPSIDSFNPGNINTWYVQYGVTFLGTAIKTFRDALQANGGNQAKAIETMLQATPNFQTVARLFADQGRPDAGSPEFKRLFDSVRAIPIPKGGLFLDKSDLYMIEGQYNLTDLLHLGNTYKTEVLVGGNWKQYVLNSQGTLFDDKDGPIHINEEGAYLQVSQPLFNEKLKLTASGRYDKNQNFKGHFTPRISGVITVAKDNYIRASYQTAYRFPTTQNQYINLEAGGGVTLLGGLPYFRDKFHYYDNPWYTPESVGKYFITHDTNSLVIQKFGEYKPELVKSFELGYKSIINRNVFIDVYGYFARYTDFLGRVTVLQSSTREARDFVHIYSISVNSDTKVSCYGWGASISYLLPDSFLINANVYSDRITDVPANFVSSFNTPKYRTNISFGNPGFLLKRKLGFNVVYHWQDSFYYESDFTSGKVPAYSTLDGQISYKIPWHNSLIKIGGTNIINKYYRNGFGNPSIGGLYYISLGYNVF